MVEAKKAACDAGGALSFFAGALSLQELQERVGVEYCIALLGRASSYESERSDYDGAPAMLRLPASSDGGDELVVPETEEGFETFEWRQRAGATAVLAKLQLGMEDLQRLLRFTEIFMWVLLSVDFEKRSALALLQKLQSEAQALTTEQLKTAFK
eukprot:5663187-Pleurochrysis_carterae.AAC.1